MRHSQTFQEALSALEALLTSRLHVTDWLRSAEAAREAIEDAPLDRKFETFDRERRTWASSLDSWISSGFSESFDLAKSFGNGVEDSPVDWAEQKVREYIQRHLHQMDVTDDYDQTAFQLETAQPAGMLDFWVKYACSGMENIGIPDDQQHVPRWLVNENAPPAQSEAELAAHVFQELRVWFLTEIENSIVRGRLAAIVKSAKAGGSYPAEKSVSREPEYMFKRRGDGWEIRFKGAHIFVRDSAGIQYIVYLLENPDKAVQVTELSALRGCTKVGDHYEQALAGYGIHRGTSKASNDGVSNYEKALMNQGLSIQAGPGDDFDSLDAKAAAEYKKEVRELQQELDQTADVWKKEAIREQIEQIEEQLRGGTWRGKPKKQGNERIRIAVTKAISAACAAIEKESPELAGYLRSHIMRGRSCRYCSDSVTWTFS
jgi:hypothetical protein